MTAVGLDVVTLTWLVSSELLIPWRGFQGFKVEMRFHEIRDMIARAPGLENF
jgi:hypothetical protein